MMFPKNAFLNNINLENAHAYFSAFNSYEYSGYNIDFAGDVNGDGYDDILIGAYGYNVERGRTFLIFGGHLEGSLNYDASFEGEDWNEYSGYSVAGIGDVNNDSYDDILIGAYGNDEGGEDTGQTYLIFGKSSGWSTGFSLHDADASFIGTSPYEKSGRSVAGVGDVNGNDYDDFLIGAFNNTEGGGDCCGKTYLIFGKESGWTRDMSLANADASFIGETELDYSGYNIDFAGDMNGDGYNDILIGAYGNDEIAPNGGQTYLIYGKPSGWSNNVSLANADASFIGVSPYEKSGIAVAGVGDVNGDGYDDFLIGANNNTESEGNYRGKTYLIFGNASIWKMNMNLMNANASFIGEDDYDRLGHSIAAAGDINDDGYDDIIIGNNFNDEGETNGGQSYIIYGKKTNWVNNFDLSNADGSFLGENNGDYSGKSVAGGGDVNGDGYDDILIGAYGYDDSYIMNGKTYLFYGPESKPILTRIPSDFSLEYGYTEELIQWRAEATYPDTYTIINSSDGSIINDSTPWESGVSIYYEIQERLPLGSYTYIINFTNIHGFHTSNSVSFDVEDTTDPVIISSPNNLTLEYGYTGASLSWTATDLNNNTYTISNSSDGSLLKDSTLWKSGDPITYEILDGLAVGTYEYIINFTDIVCNYKTHTIKIVIEETSKPILIVNQSDLNLESDYNNVFLTWTATDISPNTYIIYLNGAKIEGPVNWEDGIAIKYYIPNGLVEGTYVYKVNFTDFNGNYIVDTAIITIDIASESDNNGIPGIDLVILGIISIISIGIIIYLRYRDKFKNKSSF